VSHEPCEEHRQLAMILFWQTYLLACNRNDVQFVDPALFFGLLDTMLKDVSPNKRS